MAPHNDHHHQQHGQQQQHDNDAASFLFGLNHHFPSSSNNNNSTTNPYADNSAAIASLNLIQQPNADPFHQMDVFNTPSNSDFGSGETPSNLHGHGTGATPDSAAAQTFADQLALWTNANFSFDGPTGHALLGDDEDKDKPAEGGAHDDDLPIPDAVRSRSRNHSSHGFASSGSNSRPNSVAPGGEGRGRSNRQGTTPDPRNDSRDRAARIGEPTHQSHKEQAAAAQQQHYFAPPNDAEEARRPGKLAPSRPRAADASASSGGPSGNYRASSHARGDDASANNSSTNKEHDAAVAANLSSLFSGAARHNSTPNFGSPPAIPAGMDMTSALALQHLMASAAGNPAFALAGLGAPHFGASGHGISSPPPTTPFAAGFSGVQNPWGALNPQQIQATLAAYLTAQAQQSLGTLASANSPTAAAAATHHSLDPFVNGGSAPEALGRNNSTARHSRTHSNEAGDGGIGSGGLSAAGSSVAGDDEEGTSQQQRTKKARTSSTARSGSISASAFKPDVTGPPESPNTIAAKLERLEDDIPPLKLIDTGNPEADAEANRLAIEEDKRRRNTAASARFRIKKKQREAALEQSLRDLRAREQELEEENAALRTENGWLKSLITVRGVNGGPGGPAAAAMLEGKLHHEGGASVPNLSTPLAGENGNSHSGAAGALSRDSGLHPRGVGTDVSVEDKQGTNATAAAAARGFLNAAALYGSQRAAAENKKRDRED